MEKEREKIERMFDSIAPRYDLLNHLLSAGIDRRWRKRVVRSVAGLKPGAVLDVATGTGDLAIAIAERLPGTSVTGIDLSEGMLEIARAKAHNKGGGAPFAVRDEDIAFIRGDAAKMPFEDKRFDVVTAAFGVRNFENTANGLSEMRRVIKEGGTLFVLEFSRPKKVLRGLYGFYSRRILSFAGRIVSKDKEAYKYLPASIADFASGKEFEKLLTEAGFAETEAKPLTGGIATIYCAKR